LLFTWPKIIVEFPTAVFDTAASARLRPFLENSIASVLINLSKRGCEKRKFAPFCPVRGAAKSWLDAWPAFRGTRNR
jgi:hypothetical protein